MMEGGFNRKREPYFGFQPVTGIGPISLGEASADWSVAFYGNLIA